MEKLNPLLIAIDPGHGGQDPGAESGGRMEKDDNLRLGLALRDALTRQGIDVLMTRDSDVTLQPADRVRIANNSDAELFIALHRGYSDTPDLTCNGVQNTIYLTAPDASEQAARSVLNQVVLAGAQSDRGVRRGSHYVLRRSRMPSMMLDMGFITDSSDNRLFDGNLEKYAQAIAKGVMLYYGLEYREPPAVQPHPPVEAPPAVQSKTSDNSAANTPARAQVRQTASPRKNRPAGKEQVREAQQALNSIYGSGLEVDGVYGPASRRAAVTALQRELNGSNAGIAADGVLGPKTQAVFPTLRPGNQGGLVSLLQIILKPGGYYPHIIDGVYGPQTRMAVGMFQRDHFLIPDGIAGPRTLSYLLR